MQDLTIICCHIRLNVSQQHYISWPTCLFDPNKCHIPQICNQVVCVPTWVNVLNYRPHHTSVNCRWILLASMWWRSPMKGRDQGPGGKFAGTLFFQTSASNRKTHRNIKILLKSIHSKPRTLETVAICWLVLMLSLFYCGASAVTTKQSQVR